MSKYNRKNHCQPGQAYSDSQLLHCLMTRGELPLLNNTRNRDSYGLGDLSKFENKFHDLADVAPSGATISSIKQRLQSLRNDAKNIATAQPDSAGLTDNTGMASDANIAVAASTAEPQI